MEKFHFGFLSFYLNDKAVALKKTGLKIEMQNDDGVTVKLVFGLAYTPKTYYSGLKPIVTMGVEVPEGRHFIEKEFNIDGTNTGAGAEASVWKPLLMLPPYGGGCRAYKVFTDRIIENEYCQVKDLVPDERFKISWMGKAERPEYIQVMSSLEYKKFNSENILFSGWKSPSNLLEGGEWEVVKNSEYGIPYARKVDSSVNDGYVTSLIEEHLKDVGY